MWVGTASASPPASAISATARSQASALRLATTNLAPLGGEAVGDGQTDTPAAPGDDRYPARKVEHAGSV